MLPIRASMAAMLIAALLIPACGRLPDTSAEVTIRPVRTKTAATASPSARPSPVPTLTHSRPPSPASTPSPSPIGYTGRQVVVSGYVYDHRGATIDAASVVARSLDAAAPYYREVRTADGSYVLNGVPEGVNVEIVATRGGWTTRRRVATFQGQSSDRHTVNFGTPDGERRDGAAHFLAPFPEIVRTEPGDGDEDVAVAAGTYRLYLSEPLRAEDQRRFEAAFRILPANDVAYGGIANSTTDLRDLEDEDFPIAKAIDGVAGVAPYTVRKGSVFRNDPDTRATFTWSASGQEVTFRFGGPLLMASDDEAAYQMVLVSGGEDQRIRDDDGDQLGTDDTGSLSGYPARGDMILSAFVAENLALRDVGGLDDDSDEAAWAATHTNVVRFTAGRDTTTPELLGVVAGIQGNDARIELRFSEPLAAYDGASGGFIHPRLGDDADDLGNYTFAVATKSTKIEDIDLDGDDATAVDPRVTATLAASELRNTELRFAPGAYVESRTGAAAGSVLIEVDAFDPRRVILVVLDRPDFFDAALSHLKVRARIGDPAGNTIRDHDADDHTPVAAL